MPCTTHGSDWAPIERRAWDGKSYPREEFKIWYGNELGARCWRIALPVPRVVFWHPSPVQRVTLLREWNGRFSECERRQYVLGLFDILEIWGIQGDFSFYYDERLGHSAALRASERVTGLLLTSEDIDRLPHDIAGNAETQPGVSADVFYVTPVDVAYAIFKMKGDQPVWRCY